MAPPHFLRIYVGFSAAYMLSYVFRTVNAVISPELTTELGISAASLGLLTSAYFLAFAAMQLPAGMMLDRYGPRRVEPVLLTVAGCGALAFAAKVANRSTGGGSAQMREFLETFEHSNYFREHIAKELRAAANHASQLHALSTGR